MSELAEGARLEIVCAAKSGTEGSNPSLSAIKNIEYLRLNIADCLMVELNNTYVAVTIMQMDNLLYSFNKIDRIP